MIPDFILIIGHLDDAIVVALAIRTALRSADADLICERGVATWSSGGGCACLR